MTHSRSPAGLAGIPAVATEPPAYTDPARQDAALRLAARAVRETGIRNPLVAYAARPDWQHLVRIQGLGVIYRDTNQEVFHQDDRLGAEFGLKAGDRHAAFGERCCGGARTAEEAAQWIEALVGERQDARAEEVRLGR